MKISFLSQLDVVLKKYEQVRDETERREAKYDNVANFFVSALAAIDRIAGSDSTYAKQTRQFVQNGPISHVGVSVKLLGGVLSALRDDVTSNYLITAKELIHAEIFSDFLEMADYFLSEGYKDAAAVIGGGVLETHLRQLCIKTGIDLETLNGTKMQVKTTDRINNNLASQNIYNKLLQKSITAWLDLRNKAAHAHYSEYTNHDVILFLQGIHDFISRYPA